MCVVSVPEIASGTPSTSSAAYGMTSASRIARSATSGSAPIRPATAEAAPSGSGRAPKSSSSTTPRRSTHVGWYAVAHSAAMSPSAPVLSSSASRASSRASASTKRAITVTSAAPCTTVRTTRPRTSTRSGSVAPTYIAGPDQREDGDRHRGQGVTGDVLGGEGGEEVQEPGQDEGEGHPHQGSALAVRGDLDPPPGVDEERAALHQRHQPGHPRVGVDDSHDPAAEDDHQADEVDGVAPAEPRDSWRARPARAPTRRAPPRTSPSRRVPRPAAARQGGRRTRRGRAGWRRRAPGASAAAPRPTRRWTPRRSRWPGRRCPRPSRPGRARGPGSPPRSGRSPRAWRRSW